MKKIKMRIIGLSILLISTLFFSGMYIYGEVKDIDKVSKGYKDKLIRFHVLANSDSDEDQELKLKVRDEINNGTLKEKISTIRVYNGSKFSTVDKAVAGDVFAVTQVLQA